MDDEDDFIAIPRLAEYYPGRIPLTRIAPERK